MTENHSQRKKDGYIFLRKYETFPRIVSALSVFHAPQPGANYRDTGVAKF